jgi:hypothetical protein
MKEVIALAALAWLAGCAPSEPVEMSADGEARLAAELAGYEPAGEPVSCVARIELTGYRTAGTGAIVFDGRTNASRYVNRPNGGCTELTSTRALVLSSTSSQICRGDIATVIDPGIGTFHGSCSLGEFTPYRRVRGGD